MSDNKDFFKKQTDSSRVKAAFISEYIPRYCHIISRKFFCYLRIYNFFLDLIEY